MEEGQRQEETKKLAKEQTTIRLPAKLKEELQREADRQGVTLHDLIVFILWKELQHTVPG